MFGTGLETNSKSQFFFKTYKFPVVSYISKKNIRLTNTYSALSIFFQVGYCYITIPSLPVHYFITVA